MYHVDCRKLQAQLSLVTLTLMALMSLMKTIKVIMAIKVKYGALKKQMCEF